MSDHAIIEQGDAVPDDAGMAEGSTDGDRSRSHETHHTAGAEADGTDNGQSQEVSQERTDTAADLRALAAVLNNRVLPQQDPEVRLMIDVPEPRELVSGEAEGLSEAQAAEAVPTSECTQPTGSVAESTEEAAGFRDSSVDPPTPQDTRGRRHMRATIA